MKTIEIIEAARLVELGGKMTHGERMRLQRERLSSIVEYGRKNSPYLSKLYENLPEDYQLSDLPIMERPELVQNYEDWVTDRGISLSAVEDYGEHGEQDGGLFLGQYTVLHTSGTTGKPLYMVRDAHRNRIHGQLVAQRLLKGTAPDIMDHRKHKIAAVIRVLQGSSSYGSFLRMKASVPGKEDNIIAIDVLEDTEIIVEKLNAFQPEMLSGYSSVLVMLALEKEKGNLDIPVKLIANSAEALSPENHRLVEEAFGCPVKNNYCMTEGGEIAMTQDGPEMLLNEDFIIIEPVDENRKPVCNPDQWSEGVLVTDLTNYVQPIIRYYVNDSVKLEQIPDDQVRLPVLQVQGRASVFFELCGKVYSTLWLGIIVEDIYGVVVPQFIQVADDEIQVRGITAKDVDKEETLEALRLAVEGYFHEHGCPEAKVSYNIDPPMKKKQGGKMPQYMDLR
ncbi:MAG: hypothetical protein RR626_01615 [Anaerovoracaceae bacterium]